jgi:4-amino-4-deoxychorismate lyase
MLMPAVNLPVHWVNGKKGGGISPLDRGLRYGDGLFETVLITNGGAILWGRHLQRLLRGCESLALNVDSRSIEAHFFQFLAQLSDADRVSAIARITVSRGPGAHGYRPQRTTEPTFIVSFDKHVYVASESLRLCRCKVAAVNHSGLAGIKHLNRLANVLAAGELEDGGHDEGVMCLDDGSVISGVMSNLFIVKDGCLLTPKLSLAGVAGTARSLVIDVLAPELNVTCDETTLSYHDLLQADEIFMCNSVMGIRPVAALGETLWRDWPLTARLMDRYQLASRLETVSHKELQPMDKK